MKTTGKIRSPFLAVLLALLPVIGNAGVDIEQTPLMVAEPVAPNILFILDDSGSMRWQHMPGTTANWYNDSPGGLPYKDTIKNDIRFRASNINTQWYNPLITYKPWVNYDGSSWGNANPRSMRFDPSGKANTSNGGTGITSSFDLADSSWPSVTLNQTETALTTGAPWRYRGFYMLKSGMTETNNANYVRYEFRYGKACSVYESNGRVCKTWSGSTDHWWARKINLDSNGANSGSPIDLANFDWSSYGGPTRTIEEEIQNFANWFSYSRLRITMAKGAASHAFSKLGTGYRVGFNTIWDRLNYRIPVAKDDGLFTLDNKQDWFAKLFDAKTDQGTPLHAALKRAGDYFSEDGAGGPYGPEDKANQLSCRANFTILTTDGYWNGKPSGSTGYLANNDNTDGSEITGKDGEKFQYLKTLPYMDDNAGTLADVAMYYWNRDLRTDLINNVPVSLKNPAFWQHMRTYGISIGEKGKLTPDATTLAAIKAGAQGWGTPGNDKQENIDDLWHAAVNSRGEFIVASNPDEFVDALTDTLEEIANETKSEASGSVNSPQLKAGSRVYFSRYTSGRWDGDVFAYAIDETTGLQDQSSTAWEASAVLPAWASRNIKVDVGGTLKDFRFSNLDSDQKDWLDSQDVVDYLRGDRSKEESNGGTLRNRTGILPAFINSQSVYVAEPTLKKDFARYSFSGAGDYASYADDVDIKDRTPMLYISGNNGMLHVFEAETGVEKFVFLPSFSIGEKLQKYSQPDYGSNIEAGNPHQYILDGELTVADAYIDTGTGDRWHTILVGTQGRGGNGVFALDITDPDDIKLLWETTNGAIGNNLGKPIIAQVADKDWRVILGNGPNSTGDKAQLIMIGLADGSLTAVDTAEAGNNGLAAPTVWDGDGDGIFETAYAGDLKGNIWRFSNLGGTPTMFKLFTAQSGQSITAAPLVVVNQKTGATWVFVGTGSYLNKADLVNTDQQSWYGLIDDHATTGFPVTISSLMKRTIDTSDDSGAVLQAGTESQILQDAQFNRGWYIDFPRSGERMIMTPNYVLGGALFAFSFTPDTSDPCEPNGSSALWGIQPFSGSRLAQGIFLDGSGDPLKIDGKYASVLYAIPVVTSGSPPLTLGDDGTFSIHLPEGSIKGLLPSGEPRRQSWREVVGP